MIFFCQSLFFFLTYASLSILCILVDFFFALINMLLCVVCILWFSAGMICFFFCAFCLQSPNLANQSLLLSHPNSNRVPTHTRYDFFFLSISVFFFFLHMLCDSVYLLVYPYKKIRVWVFCVFWLIFFCINKSIILCSVCILWFSVAMIFFCAFCVFCMIL